MHQCNIKSCLANREGELGFWLQQDFREQLQGIGTKWHHMGRGCKQVVNPPRTWQD